MNKNYLLIIPTYNEKENIDIIYRKISSLNLNLDILFIDDNSPDGTGNKLDELSKENDFIKTIHRNNKQGIGSAHILGLEYAYKNKYQFAITMDCDLSHDPKYLAKFIESIKKSDIVIGTRFKSQYSISTWNYYRKFLTRIGHFASIIFLGMPYDSTGAFRAYSLVNIDKIFIKKLNFSGYSFFFESLFILHKNNYKIIEIPIDLPSRVYGSSKQSYKDIYLGIKNLMLIYVFRIFAAKKFIILREPFNFKLKGSLSDPQNWDMYWSKKTSKIIYDFIAFYYRKFLIKPSLNYHISKFFNDDSTLLHAGCGGGEVDKEISKKFDITAIDISEKALNLYSQNNLTSKKIFHDSIFNTDFKKNSFDGIYNLGVMEHFTEIEIIQILNEFNRILEENGKILIFWPHKKGISVIFLKLIHYILNKIIKIDTKLHPKEITHVKSKKQISDILSKAGFELNYYYFGFMDLFTQAVIVGKKKK